jgi:RNA recognition motif-containing protein
MRKFVVQVKSVFVDGMPPAWDEEKVREHFGKFGEIDRIVLARNMSAAKRKDFGFVNYVEREAAMACIDAISNSGIVDGEIKVNNLSHRSTYDHVLDFRNWIWQLVICSVHRRQTKWFQEGLFSGMVVLERLF